MERGDESDCCILHFVFEHSPAFHRGVVLGGKWYPPTVVTLYIQHTAVLDNDIPQPPLRL